MENTSSSAASELADIIILLKEKYKIEDLDTIILYQKIIAYVNNAIGIDIEEVESELEATL